MQLEHLHYPLLKSCDWLIPLDIMTSNPQGMKIRSLYSMYEQSMSATAKT